AFPTKSLLSVDDSAIGEQFILVKMNEVLSEKDQVSFIERFKQFGHVKHWVSDKYGQSTVFALIVKDVARDWNEQLQARWEQKIHEIKMRPVFTYGCEESEEQLAAAHVSE